MTEEKARLYKKARFTNEARGLEPGFPGGPVRVKFLAMMWNAYHRVHEPVFSVYRLNRSGDFVGTYFARSLQDFAP
jgi:hypothetical protein